jgi:hypothetical protein
MNQPSRLRGRRCPLMGAPTKELEGIGVSAARDSPSIDTETLLAASYGIITGADNSVTTVTTGARQQSSPASSGRFSPEVRPTSRGLRQMPRDKGSLRSSKGIPAPPRHHRSPHWARLLRGGVQCSAAEAYTLMRLSRSSLSEIRLVQRGRAIHTSWHHQRTLDAHLDCRDRHEVRCGSSQ